MAGIEEIRPTPKSYPTISPRRPLNAPGRRWRAMRPLVRRQRLVQAVSKEGRPAGGEGKKAWVAKGALDLNLLDGLRSNPSC